MGVTSGNTEHAIFSYIFNKKVFEQVSSISSQNKMLIQGVDDPVLMKLMKLLNYIRKTWITSTVYQISSWCVFGQPIRTNNGVEGWHRRLNKKACDLTPPFYDLVTFLHAEASLLPIQHIPTVRPVFQQGGDNPASEEMWPYQRY